MIIDARHYGAKCDRETDDIEALERALEAARGLVAGSWEETGDTKSWTWQPQVIVRLSGMCRLSRPLKIQHHRIALVGGGIGSGAFGPGGIIADHQNPAIEVDSTQGSWRARNVALDGLLITRDRSNRVLGAHGIAVHSHGQPGNWTRDLLIQNCTISNHDYGVAPIYGEASFAGLNIYQSALVHCRYGLNTTKPEGSPGSGMVQLTLFRCERCDITQNTYGGILAEISGGTITDCDFEGQRSPVIVTGANPAHLVLGPNYLEGMKHEWEHGLEGIHLNRVNHFQVAGQRVAGVFDGTPIYCHGCSDGEVPPATVLDSCYNVRVRGELATAKVRGSISLDDEGELEVVEAEAANTMLVMPWSVQRPACTLEGVTKAHLTGFASPVTGHSAGAEAPLQVADGDLLAAAIAVRYVEPLRKTRMAYPFGGEGHSAPRMMLEGRDGAGTWHMLRDPWTYIGGGRVMPGNGTFTFLMTAQNMTGAPLTEVRLTVYPAGREVSGSGARLSDSVVWIVPRDIPLWTPEDLPSTTHFTWRNIWIPETGTPP